MEVKRPHLSRIAAQNFRNYSFVEAELAEGWTVFVGPNGAGKTNLLELIVFNLQGVSFRGKISNLIKWGETETKVRSVLDNENVATNVRVDGGKINRKRLFNEKEQAEWGSVIPPVVLFLPQEEYLLDSAAGRRRIMSRGLLLQSLRYRTFFLQFQHLLKQRNYLLKNQMKSTFHEELRAWTEAIILPAIRIWEIRKGFVEKINRRLPEVLDDLGGVGRRLQVNLSMGGVVGGFGQEITSELLYSRFVAIREKELERQTTLIGPHRDVLRITHEGRDVLPALSRGQRRLLLLALHLIEGEYATEQSPFRSLYILDDVFSELDPAHRDSIKSTLQAEQVVASTADEKILPKLDKGTYYYSVKDGRLEKYGIN